MEKVFKQYSEIDFLIQNLVKCNEKINSLKKYKKDLENCKIDYLDFEIGTIEPTNDKFSTSVYDKSLISEQVFVDVDKPLELEEKDVFKEEILKIHFKHINEYILLFEETKDRILQQLKQFNNVEK